MANASIRVHSKSEYTIEVNDNGDVITFDVTDTSLTSKYVNAFEKLDGFVKKYEADVTAIDKRKDEPYKTTETKDYVTGEIETNTLITKNQYDIAILTDQFYKDSRIAMDGFLGRGACQKIFGDKNYFNMFNDLSEQLAPHLKKMGIEAEKLKTTALKKYAPNREQHRALK